MPRLFAAEGNILVMERVTGRSWAALVRCGQGQSPPLVASFAQALRALTVDGAGRLGARVDRAALAENTSVLLASGRTLLGENPGICREPIFHETFRRVEAAAPRLLAAPPAYFFSDPAPANVIVDDGRVVRFVDLEALWPGTTPLAIGACVHVYARDDLRLELPMTLVLPRVKQAFRGAAASALAFDQALVRDAALFAAWVQIARYHGWSGWRTCTPGRLAGDLEVERASAKIHAAELTAVLEGVEIYCAA